MTDSPPVPVRVVSYTRGVLIFWPSVITALISVARLLAEKEGKIDPASGGAGAWLGITWCMFVFGGWFGWRLAREGHGPRVRRFWIWPLVALIAVVGTLAIGMSGVDMNDKTPALMENLRPTMLATMVVCIVGVAALFFAWRRLAWTLLVYGLIARVTVIALTWIAKDNGWNTHYTKFGPHGLAFDMTKTMVDASWVQLGFWVPMTVITGSLVGSLFARKRS